MKSKIVCLSKNDEFKEILKGEKKSNKFFTIFFKKLSNKDKKKFVPRISFSNLFEITDGQRFGGP